MTDIQIQRKQPHTWTIILAIFVVVVVIMFLIIRHNSSVSVAMTVPTQTTAITSILHQNPQLP